MSVRESHDGPAWMRVGARVRLIPEPTIQGMVVFTVNEFTRARPRPRADMVAELQYVNTVNGIPTSAAVDFGEGYGSWVVDVECVIHDVPDLSDREAVAQWLTG